MVKYTVVSTFAGGGGSSLGHKLAGYNELLAIEWDKNAREVLKLNFPDLLIWEKDITKVQNNDILKECNLEIGELDLLDGSPPCQGFSMTGKREINDSRNELFLSYCKLLKELKPKVFVMENVSGMIKGKMRGMWTIIMKELENSGYNVKCKLMNAMYYNVPQSRERLIFIGIRKDIKIDVCFPEAQNRIITVKEALRDVKNTEIKYLTGQIKNLYKNINVGKGLEEYWEKINGKRSYFNIKKLHPNKPSNTITKMFKTGCAGILHWEQERFITIEEAKRICSFPDDYVLTGKFEDKWARLGNAVMPNMMKAIAENIKINILDKYYGVVKI
jgi:DNA (cytosine-5)-methyltransferase 1